MKIRFPYFKVGSGGFYESPGKMILNNRKIRTKDSNEVKEAIYSPISTWVDITVSDKKRVGLPVNFVFTEEGYRVGQKEYLAHLGWFQKQQLMWMYRNHWLQRPGNLKHITLILLLVVVALFGMFYLEMHTNF